MKKNFLAYLFLLANTVLFAQSTPESVLQKLPVAPDTKKVCSATGETKRLYRETVEGFEEMVEETLSNLEENEEQDAITMQEQAKKKIAADYNISASDMQKMQKGNMSEAEKQAMIDKMMQQKFNISMEEVKDVSKMSKSGQEAWAEGFATEQIAEAEANPKKNQEELKKNMSLFEMTKEKDELYKKLMAEERAIGEKFAELDSDKAGIKLLKEIDSLFAAYSKLIGIDYGQGGQMEAIRTQITLKRQAYCNKYSPLYLNLLDQHRVMVSKNIPDYYRLEELTNKTNKAVLGTSIDVVKKGALGFQFLKGYIRKLKDAYKYCIYDTDNEFISPIFTR